MLSTDALPYLITCSYAQKKLKIVQNKELLPAIIAGLLRKRQSLHPYIAQVSSDTCPLKFQKFSSALDCTFFLNL